MKVDKPQMNIKVVNEKATTSIVHDISTIEMAINNHMVVIQVQIGKNTIDDVLLDGEFGANIIIEQSRARLGLPKPKPTPYNLQMVDQTTTKPIGMIKDLSMYVHGIPYISTFTILQSIVVDSSYSMLLYRPWLKDVKVAHD